MASILIVDDEKQIRKLLASAFVRAGFRVRVADSAKTALDLCRGECFDAVLSDVVMPGIDGHELARRLAARCPQSRVVLMSASDPGCSECPFEAGCPRVGKPFVIREVLALISNLLPAAQADPVD